MAVMSENNQTIMSANKATAATDKLNSIAPNWLADMATAPADPVFGLMEIFRRDPRTDKINLTVGAYQDDSGQTPVLECVKRAEQQLWQRQKTKNYLPIDGLAGFNEAIPPLIFGADHEVLASGRAAAVQTPGGTAALRVVGDLLRRVLGVRKIWISNPTWANHPQIFTAADLQIQHYSYVAADCSGLDFAKLSGQLEQAEPGDAVLMHAVCHNPTGFDFSREQWQSLRELVRARRLIPVFDFAYQGFSESIETDPWPIHWFAQDLSELFICTSFSKNMGLYGERVGALTVVARSSDRLPAAISQIKSLIRTYYSTPPLQGGAIADCVLHDQELRQLWSQEVDQMRQRIQRVREQFVQRLGQSIPQRSFGYILDQRGMFSFSGLSREQAIRLREEFGVYMVESGRINIAGINDRNLERLCETIGQVVNNK